MTRDDVVLEVDGVGKRFGRRDVLKAASFRARVGAITVLMGRNGTGKTTLMRVAVGRVRPERGRVLYDGLYRPRPALHRLARAGLMYLDQESALTSLFSVRDHLASVARTFGSGARMQEVVDRLALGEFLGRRPGDVSRGERQRAALALSMLRSPRCLLMDEPFAGVAPRDRPLVAHGLESLREAGAAVVVSGHDVEDLLAVADDVIWVVAGTTHWLGTPAEAAADEGFRRDYLGSRA